MTTQSSKFIVRHLTAAEGYLDLGMPKQALAELNAVTEPGQFRPPYRWMLGEALKADGRFQEAIEPLRDAAHSLPGPIAARALAALNQCLEHCGQPAETAPEPKPSAAENQMAAFVTVLKDRLPLSVKIPNVGTLSLSFDADNVLSIKLQQESNADS